MFFTILFFFNDPATTAIYTLSLHDALPISVAGPQRRRDERPRAAAVGARVDAGVGVDGRQQRPRRVSGDRERCERRPETSEDRKSTRLNSSHSSISYAVFCLKKKKKKTTDN